jgi:hypothetical protein
MHKQAILTTHQMLKIKCSDTKSAMLTALTKLACNLFLLFSLIVEKVNVCMTLLGSGLRLQTARRLASQWFDSTLRTSYIHVLLPIQSLRNYAPGAVLAETCIV